MTDLHFVLFPLMAQGHLVPMVDIARILAQRGATVTIITTPHDANRIRPVISRAVEANLKIQLLTLELRSAQVGLPDGCESFDKLPSFEYWKNINTACQLLEQPAEDLLREISPPPDCIISDFLFPWTTDVARRLNIPRFVFNGPGCFYLLCMHVALNSNVLGGGNGSVNERVVLPGLPNRIEVTKLQITGSSKQVSEEDMGFWFRAVEAENAAYGIVVHTFEELEPEYVKKYKLVKDKKIWCIGPVSLCNKTGPDLTNRGDKAAITEHNCLKWLDERELGSVLYVCLGSLARVSTAQAIELGLGLESINRPFIWCIRNKSKELETWLSEGFEDRVRDRGLIVRGWAPQVLMLSHPAIGGFVTHCGWNSTLESISAGVPMITWPFFADQFLNETFIVEILNIGVRIGVQIPVLFGEEDKVGVLVKKEDVKKAVECLMDEVEDGEQRRKRVMELAKMAKTAMAEGGSSYENITSLIRDVKTVRTQI